MNPTRLLLVDDHHVVRTAVASFLRKEPDLEVVGEVDEASQLLPLVEECRPDVIILDAHMPGQNVIQTARTLCRRWPDLHILVLSAYDRREYVVGLLRAGASGYVLKDDTPEMLIRAVRAVAAGQEWLSPRVLNILMKSVRGQNPRPFARLTNRELEVLRLMAAGRRNEEIAEEMVITYQTVKNYVRSIFSKLGVETRVDAVLYAIEHELEGPAGEPG